MPIKDTRIYQVIQAGKQDAVLWQANRWLAAAGTDAFDQSKAHKDIARLIRLFKSEALQLTYTDQISKTFKVPRKVLSAAIDQEKQHAEDNGDDEEEDIYKKLPKWMDKEDILNKGFCEVKDKPRIGYYSFGKNGKEHISNFIIHPIFHVPNKEESRHIFEIENKRHRIIMDVPSKVFISTEILLNHLVGEGNFMFYGSKLQLMRIATEILDQFPKCIEIRRLGWQNTAGFYAYLDRIYIPGEGFKMTDKYGIVSHNDNNYLIPAASDVYKHMPGADDPYENDRVMEYIKAPVSFSEWAQQMHRVYLDKGLTAIAYAFLTIFRDIVFKIDNNCPHLYGYGETSSGKSKWAESFTALFYKDRSAFSLNSGTDYAFFDYKQRFTNTPHHLNEFDDKTIKEQWQHSLKNDFDGEGRERGVLKAGSSGKVKTEVMRLTGTLVITGQYISTRDDNANINRSIVEAFSIRNLTEEDKTEFEKLRSWQDIGLTSMVSDIVEHRDYVKKRYYEIYNEILVKWMRAGEQYNQRILRNHCHLSAMWFIFCDKFQLPVSFPDFDTMMYNKAKELSKFVRASDTLTDFWNTVAFLLDQQQIIEGWDFKIETVTEIRLRDGNGDESVREFTEPTKILIIRLNNVHKLYQQAYKSRSNQPGMTLENLMHYFSNRPYYIGKVKQSRFKRFVWKASEKVTQTAFGPETASINNQHIKEEINSSAYVFNYNELGCELERVDVANEGII